MYKISIQFGYLLKFQLFILLLTRLARNILDYSFHNCEIWDLGNLQHSPTLQYYKIVDNLSEKCKMWHILFLSDSHLLYFDIKCSWIKFHFPFCFRGRQLVEWILKKICVVCIYYMAIYVRDHKGIIVKLLTMTVWNKNWKL